MRILLTNDDGYLAPGINITFQHLNAAGHEVNIIAPERNSSGTAQSIAVYTPFTITQVNPQIYFVSSTPADSIRLGLQEIYAQGYPDLIISGINMGENIGEDVLYSGTVGAAREGAMQGVSSLAFSTSGPKYHHLDSAAKIVIDLVARLDKNREVLKSPFIWNINIPNLHYDQIIGFEATKLGFRPRHQPLIKQSSPRGDTIYWQGGTNEPEHGEIGTDIAVFLERNKVSVTPIEILPTDLTQMATISAICD